MPAPKKEYKSKAITTSIKYTSRVSLKIGDSFYTLEACEERHIPEDKTIIIEKERGLLWEEVNWQVDNQAEQIIKMSK